MKVDDTNLPISARCDRQKGVTTVACAMTLVLITLVVVTATPNLSVMIPTTVQHVIVAVLAGQFATWTFSGRRENK
jgi:hypothetical protein